MDDEMENLLEVLMQDEKFKAEYQRHLMIALMFGAQGYGKNYRAKEKMMRSSVPSTLDNGKLGVGTLYGKAVLPPKVCNYRKPKLYWYGEMHSSNNFVWNDGYTMARHWNILPDRLTLKGRNPSEGLSVWPAAPMGSTTGRNPLEGKRFIGISEADEFVTKTYNKKSEAWKPQGEIFITSGKPLRMNDKSKETIERVQRIEFPED